MGVRWVSDGCLVVYNAAVVLSGGRTAEERKGGLEMRILSYEGGESRVMRLYMVIHEMRILSYQDNRTVNPNPNAL